MSTIFHFRSLPSRLGLLRLVATDRGLAAVLWPDDPPARVPLGTMIEAPDQGILVEAERQLNQYLDGARLTFELPLDFRGTDFQRQVWSALLTIPFGETRSYADLARQVGRPGASRAVGSANGRNPLSIVVPCHRVVGSDGALTGFAGGLPAKEHLLGLERTMLARLRRDTPS